MTVLGPWGGGPTRGGGVGIASAQGDLLEGWVAPGQQRPQNIPPLHNRHGAKGPRGSCLLFETLSAFGLGPLSTTLGFSHHVGCFFLFSLLLLLHRLPSF